MASVALPANAHRVPALLSSGELVPSGSADCRCSPPSDVGFSPQRGPRPDPCIVPKRIFFQISRLYTSTLVYFLLLLRLASRCCFCSFLFFFFFVIGRFLWTSIDVTNIRISSWCFLSFRRERRRDVVAILSDRQYVVWQVTWNFVIFVLSLEVDTVSYQI